MRSVVDQCVVLNTWIVCVHGGILWQAAGVNLSSLGTLYSSRVVGPLLEGSGRSKGACRLKVLVCISRLPIPPVWVPLLPYRSPARRRWGKFVFLSSPFSEGLPLLRFRLAWSSALETVQLQEMRVDLSAAKEALWLSPFAWVWWLFQPFVFSFQSISGTQQQLQFLCSFYVCFLAALKRVGSQIPVQRWNLCLLHWMCGVLTTGPPGKSRSFSYSYYFSHNLFNTRDVTWAPASSSSHDPVHHNESLSNGPATLGEGRAVFYLQCWGPLLGSCGGIQLQNPVLRVCLPQPLHSSKSVRRGQPGWEGACQTVGVAAG